MECSPGGRFLISREILTPLAAGVSVAVPTLWPCAFLMSTVMGFAAARTWLSCAKNRPAADNNSVTRTKNLIMILLESNGSLESELSQKNAHLNLAQDRPGSNNLSSKRQPRHCRRKNDRGLRLIEARKVFFQVFQFREVVVDDIGIVGIVLQIILMVALSGIEGLERLDFRDDGTGVDFCSIELRDVSLRDAFLFLARVEDGGAVLRAGVRALAIPLGGIVRDGKENHQELAVSEP